MDFFFLATWMRVIGHPEIPGIASECTTRYSDACTHVRLEFSVQYIPGMHETVKIAQESNRSALWDPTKLLEKKILYCNIKNKRVYIF